MILGGGGGSGDVATSTSASSCSCPVPIGTQVMVHLVDTVARAACVPTCASAACVYWARNLLHLGVPKCAEEDGVYLVFLVLCVMFLSTCPIGVRI